jgi:hypothetical protein
MVWKLDFDQYSVLARSVLFTSCLFSTFRPFFWKYNAVICHKTFNQTTDIQYDGFDWIKNKKQWATNVIVDQKKPLDKLTIFFFDKNHPAGPSF